MAEVTYAPATFTGPNGPMETHADISQHLPGLVAIETVTGGWSVLERATGRWQGALAFGPYESEDEAIAVEGMLALLASGEHYVMLPLNRPVWTSDALLYCTATRVGTHGGTVLGVMQGAMVESMKVGQMFTVGDPDDSDTQHPRRVRKVVGIDREGGAAYIHQWPPLPQAETGTGNAAALVQPATHIPARAARPGSGSQPMPRDAGAPGTYGPWVFEWVEYIFTGGG